MGPGKAATKAQKRRMGLIKEIGCVACRKRDLYFMAQAHHIIEGGRRLGHDYTIPLCVWHHVGDTPEHFDDGSMYILFGPSLIHKKAFEEEFGTEMELLEYTNQLLGAVEQGDLMPGML